MTQKLAEHRDLTERSRGPEFKELQVKVIENGLEYDRLRIKCEKWGEKSDSVVLKLTKDILSKPAEGAETHVGKGMTSSEAESIFINGHMDVSFEAGKGVTVSYEGSPTFVGPDAELSVGNVRQVLSPFLKHQDDSIYEEMGIAFEYAHDVRFLGGAEDPRGYLKNGTLFESYNTDALGVSSREKYQNTPVFWSTNGFLIAVLSFEPCLIDFGNRRHQIIEFSTKSSSLEILFYKCSSPNLAFASFRDHFGTCHEPPSWSYGVWLSRCYYKDQKELESVLESATFHNMAFSAVNLDARSWMVPDNRTDFVWDDSRWESFKTFIPKLRDKGLNVCLWENPYVSCHSKLFVEGDKKGYFAKDGFGQTYLFDWVPDGLEGFPKPPKAAIVDFTCEKAVAWWQNLHVPYVEAGVRAFKTDFGEEVPHDCLFSNGKTGYEMRNRFSDLYNQAVYDVFERLGVEDGMIWARSFSQYAARYPVKWNGDSQTNFRALYASLKAGLTQACGGALFWSYDSGGFYGPQPTEEFYLRSVQMGLWCSHVRLHGTSVREPWEFGPEVTKRLKIDFEIRHMLSNYIEIESGHCVEQRKSFMRPVWLEHEVADYMHIDDQFYFGKAFLVAPFLTKEKGRRVFLPDGDWMSLCGGNRMQGPIVFHHERSDALPVFYKIGTQTSELEKPLDETVMAIVKLNIIN